MTAAKWRGERAILTGYRHRSTFIDGSAYKVGYCLKWVRQMFGIPAKYTYAYQVWQNCPSRYRHVTSSAPPRGSVALYRVNNTSGYPGHIAISLGGGNILSTDLPDSGRVGVVNYMTPVRRWGLQYVGYTWWVNGQTIGCPTVDQSRLYYAASGHPWAYKLGTARTQYWLKQRGYGSGFITGRWGSGTKRAWKKWEIYLDSHGTNTDRDGKPGWAAFMASARRSPYRIVRK